MVKLKQLPKFILTILLITIVQLLLLVAVACIPRSAIKSNITESADYLNEHSVFYYANDKDNASRIDHYADSILLNIAYCYDSHQPFTSVMRSAYYYTEMDNENVNLQNVIQHNYKPTLEYIRYWHGSIVIIRPLLTIFNIEQIYILNGILIIVLLIVLLTLIYRKLGIGTVVCFLISVIMTSLWYVPLSLEYTWTVLIMLIASIIILHLCEKKDISLLLFFMFTGSFTAYFDFLTTETLTLLVPLALLLVCKCKNNSLSDFKSMFLFAISKALLWITGYASAWIAKWTLASIILKENAFEAALSQAAIRVNGAAESHSGLALGFGALVRNISCIFPFSLNQSTGFSLCVIIIIILLILFYLTKKDKCSLSIMLFFIGFIPYIRFFVLSNHSYMHYFFTYRAQLATILCIGIALLYGIDRNLINKEWRKLWKKKK